MTIVCKVCNSVFDAGTRRICASGKFVNHEPPHHAACIPMQRRMSTPCCPFRFVIYPMASVRLLPVAPSVRTVALPNKR